jgi:hypothetical protein
VGIERTAAVIRERKLLRGVVPPAVASGERLQHQGLRLRLGPTVLGIWHFRNDPCGISRVGPVVRVVNRAIASWWGGPVEA